LGLGVWVWGYGVGGLAPTPQAPIPNPQSPIPNPHYEDILLNILIIENKLNYIFNNFYLNIII